MDRPLHWGEGDPVDFPWWGEAPAMGPYQYGEGVRPSVQVVADRGIIRPGEQVTLRAVARGLKPPLKYAWQVGDGATGNSESVTHKFGEARDYGIRVRVTDASGESRIGVGYVLVEEKNPEGRLRAEICDREGNPFTYARE